MRKAAPKLLLLALNMTVLGTIPGIRVKNADE